MPSLSRRTAVALLDVTARKSISTPFSHSAVSSSATLSVGTPDSPSVPKIFDIFDAPVMLKNWSNNSGSAKPPNSVSAARISSEISRLGSRNIHSDAMGLPWSLPPPVVFDGPARPPHMSPSTLQKRRLERRSSARLPRQVYGASTTSFSALTPASEPLYQVFDGPSRINRYRYPSSHDEKFSITYVSLALCISSAFGWLAFNDTLDSLDRSDILSS